MNRNAKKGPMLAAPSQDSAAGGKSAVNVPHGTALANWWARAETAWAMSNFPKYGTAAWTVMQPEDPRRLAAVLDAAEKWRLYGDEEELFRWFREATAPHPPLWIGHSRAELDALAEPKPPHQLQATAGWPPIAVPGQPGRYLSCETWKEAA